MIKKLEDRLKKLTEQYLSICKSTTWTAGNHDQMVIAIQDISQEIHFTQKWIKTLEKTEVNDD